MKKCYALLCAVLVFTGALAAQGAVSAEASANLLSSANSYMTSPYNAWYVFQDGELQYSSGENPYLIFKTVSGKNWCSPALNLGCVPMGGVFQLDYDIYLVSGYDVTSLNNVIRSKNQLSLSTAYNKSSASYYGSIGRLQARTNQWVHFTTTFGIRNEESHLLSQEAMFCFDNIGADITYIYLDNVELRLLDYTYTATMQPIDPNGELNPTPVPTPRLFDSLSTMPPTAPPAVLPTVPPVQTPVLPSAAPTVVLETAEPFSPAAGDGENLLEPASSSFEGIDPGVEVSWVKQNGTLKIDENGYEGSCLTLCDISSGDSPYLKLSKYITEPGLYTVSLMLRVTYAGEAEPAVPSLTLQSSTPGGMFSSSRDGRYFSDIAVAPQALEDQQWYELSGSFAVEELPGENAQWMLFVSGLPAQVQQISIDNVSLVRGRLTVERTPVQTEETQEKMKNISLPVGWIIGLGSVGAAGVICLAATLILLGVRRKKDRRDRSSKENDEVSQLFR